MQKMLDYDQVDLSCLADILCLQCLASDILDIGYWSVHNADGQSRGVKVAPLARQVTGDPLSFEFEHVQLKKE